MKKFAALIAAAVLALATVAPVLASVPPGQQGYEGQPGNQGGFHQAGQQGYEGQPGNQGGFHQAGQQGYEGQPGNQGGQQHNP
jgi:collagen type IV alpha